MIILAYRQITVFGNGSSGLLVGAAGATFIRRGTKGIREYYN
jgi:hypothetical protein